MFPQTQTSAAHQSLTQQQQWQMRYGCIAARIGADIQHKLGIDMPVERPSHSTATDANAMGRKRGAKNPLPYTVEADESQPRAPGKPIPIIPKYAKAGSNVSITVEDVTRFPDEAAAGHWMCKHPECKGERWKTKRELLKAHPAQKELEQAQATHVYYCVYEVAGKPATEGKAAKLDGEGKVVKAAVEPTDATDSIVMLFSDEE